MNRRSWQQRRVWPTVVALILGGIGVLIGPEVSFAADRPNLVLIVTDDQDVATLPFMPIVQERLVRQGTSFDNAFVTITACCPSRVSILRGQYSHNHGVLTNSDEAFQKFVSLELERSTLATWLHSAGYETALIGKFLNGYVNRPSYVPEGWSDWYAALDHAYLESSLSDNGQKVRLGEPGPSYLTDALADRAAKFLRSVPRGKPFFVYLAPIAPHKPAVPAARHQGAFADLEAPRPESFNEADVSDKPSFIRSRDRLLPAQVANIDRQYRKRLRSLQAVDEMVGQLLETLESSGRLEQTYFVFTSDSGYHLGQHRLSSGKGGPYEENIRVPLIIRGPGVARGRNVKAMALNIDIAPTLAELAGVEPPAFVDGRSLGPWLQLQPVESLPWRRSFLIEHWGPRKGFFGLRGESYVYVEYASGEREFYDLEGDPYQLDGKAPLEPTSATRLSSALEEFVKCGGPSCRSFEDATLVPPRP